MAELKQSALALLAKLIAFDSVSRNSNIPIIEFIETYLSNHQVPTTRIPSPDGKKCNLLARIGPDVAGGMILSGHTDVVPVDGQAWDSDPFTLTEKDGKLFGRGAADMKSFIAICLALVPEFKTRAKNKPIYLAFSYDEEVGCLGAPHLLDYVVANIQKPAFAVIGEPTMMQVVTAHKGVMSFETTVQGLEWHSSQPHLGVNAVAYGCELVHFLTKLAREVAATSSTDARFDPPYSTVHVGTISGGTARNIIARECHFQWEIRPLPGFNADALIERFSARCRELEATMKQTFTAAAITTRPMSRMSGVTLPPDAAPCCQRVMHAAKTNREVAVAFGTEAGVFNDHGVPAIICGPGDIQQAHKPNEFIELTQIDACIDFLRRLTPGFLMYSKTTRDIKVNVVPLYLADQSDPIDHHYVWAYTIQIQNQGTQTVQLLNRYWHITDAQGTVQEVRGAGVVGEQPVLEPGDHYQYSSGAALRTSSGIMVGHYEMATDNGEQFTIDIPAFSLDSPEQVRRPN